MIASLPASPAPPVSPCADPTAAIVAQLRSDGFTVVDNLVPPDVAARIRADAAFRFTDGEFQAARVGHADLKRKAEIRGDFIRWIEPPGDSPAVRDYFAFIERLRLTLNRELLLGAFEFEGHFAVFPPGAGYKRHVDASPDSDRRVLTAILYLNPAWREEDGGALTAWTSTGETLARILPEEGRFVAFLSEEIPHEVAAAQRERWSLTGWFCRRSGPA